MPVSRPLRHTLFLCAAEILALTGIATFPALLPMFQAEWHLSHTQAGWIGAAYFAGYMLFVPVLSGITDRYDARRIVMIGGVTSVLATAAYAVMAGGFISALLLRFLAGVGLAGIYMPGLKLVGDHTEGPRQTRYISFYTASFAVGTSLSYLLAGELDILFGWRWTFGIAAMGPAAAVVCVACFVPPGSVRTGTAPLQLSTDFRRVWRVKPARAYILGYAAHMWELFGMRTWIVAFLAFSQSLQPTTGGLRPTQAAFLINLIGIAASIGGNELARAFGRRRVIRTLMLASAAVAAVTGFSSGLPYAWVCAMTLLYGVTILSDSAALTAGAAQAAPPGFRGATLAVHSTLGFGAAFLGPLAVGAVLDGFGAGRIAWGLAFVVMGVGCLMGVAALSTGWTDRR